MSKVLDITRIWLDKCFAEAELLSHRRCFSEIDQSLLRGAVSGNPESITISRIYALFCFGEIQGGSAENSHNVVSDACCRHNRLTNGEQKQLSLTGNGIALLLYGGDTKLDLDVSQILPDCYRATLQMMHFLLARGRRRIAFLGAALEEEPRFRAYSDLLRKAELPLLPIPFVCSSDEFMDAGFRATV